MADDGRLDVGFGLDTSQADVELQRLKSQLDGVTANLLQTQKVIETKTAKMVADLTAAMGKINAGTANYTRRVQSLESNVGRALGSSARGGLSSQQLDAAARSVIADSRNSAEQVTARITNELVNQYTQRIKAMDGMVAAKLRATAASATAYQADNSPEMLAAKKILAERSRQNTLLSAQYGPGAVANRNTLDRLNANGGADIIAVQSKLLLGYAGLSAVFNSVKGMTSFVIELDRELKNFQSITDATNSEMDLLKTRFNDTAAASHFSALEIAKAAVTLGQAGLSAREVADSIGSISKLATASGSDLASAVDVVTSAMSIFDLQTSQTVDIANTLTSALNLSKLTIDKVALGLQYSGQIAAQSGVSFNELIGTLGALSNSGIRNGSTLGTGLRQLIIELQTPSAKLTKTLKDLNLTQQDIDISSNGLIPVINTLSKAGFGASQAFEAMDIRGAAAYVALSKNTDVAEKLEQQFLLSNAATDANDKQMTSLGNTMDRFGSILGTVSATAMQPFLDLLQKLLKTAGDVLEQLNHYPTVLETIGVAVAALGVALTVKMLVPLVRAVPVLFGFGAAVAGAETAIAGVGASLFGLGVAGGPLALVVAGVTALALLWDVFVPKTQSAAEKVDALQGAVNELGGEADTTRQHIDSINSTISNLLKQKEALDRDPLMKNARVMEVTSQFKELAANVDLTKTSVDDLVASMRKLGEQDLQKLSAQLNEAIKADEELINAKKAQFNEQRIGASQPLRAQVLNFELANDHPFGGDTFHINGTSPSNADYPAVASGIAAYYDKVLGSRFGDYARLALDPQRAFPDTTKAAFMGSDINSQISDLTSTQTQLLMRQKAGTITPADAETLTRLPLLLSMLQALHDALDPLIATTNSISSTEFDKSIKTSDKLRADVQSSSQYQALLKQAQDLNQSLGADYNTIGKNAKGKTAQDLQKAYGDLQKSFDQRVGDFTTATEKAASDIANNLGVDPKDVEAVMDTLGTDLANTKAQIKDKLDDTNKVVSKVTVEQLNNQIETINGELSLATKQGRNAYTRDQIETIEDYVRQLFDQKRDLLKQVYDAKLAAAGDDISQQEQIQADLREKQKQSFTDEQSALSDLTDSAASVYSKQLDAAKRNLDDEISASKTQMSSLLSSMKKLKPGAAFDALKSQFDTVAAQLATLEQQANAVDLTKNANASGIVLSRTSASNAAQAMSYFVGKGLSQTQASGLVGRLLTESGLHPGMVGDNGQAQGIAQWHPDRWSNFKGNPTSLQDQLDFIWQELTGSESGSLAKLKAAQTPYDSALAAMSFERPKGYTSDHPENGLGFAQTVGNANALAQGSYSSVAADAAAQGQDLADTVTAAALKGAQAAATDAVKAANNRIATLVTQSKGLSDPKAVQDILDSVNDQYSKIIDQKTKLFDQQNSGNLDNPDITDQRDQLIEGLRSDQEQKISQLLDQYWSAVQKKTQDLVDTAQNALDQAQLPKNVNRFTSAQLTQLQGNITAAQQAADTQKLVAAKALLAQTTTQLDDAEAKYGKDSQEANFWENEKAAALDRVTQLTREKTQADQASNQQSASVIDAIRSATQAYLEQAGVLDSTTLKAVPLAKQIEQNFGNVIDGVSNSMSTLFENLVQGTMSVGEAFRQFGASAVQTLIAVIAKALTLQIIMGTLGGGGSSSGSSGFFGNILSGLFGSTGMKLGGMVRAANGFAVPTRDSVPALLMPDEFVLRQSAVSAIGRDTLTTMNNMGNRSISKGINQLPANNNGKGSVTNVYVVTPDQVPASMGPNDVIATVADNIQNRGPLKTLIKSVVNGSI